MAEENTTDVANSEATQTGATEATDTTTSNTGTETGNPPKDDAGDPASDPAKEGVDLLDGDEDGLARGDNPDDEGEKQDGDADPASLTGAPEGEYDITLPEGMALDADALTAFTPIAKELNLSNEGVSKLASEAYPLVEGQVQKAMVNEVLAQRKAWTDASRAMISGGKDAEGKDVAPAAVFQGDNYDAVMATAARSIDRFTSDESGQPIMFENAKDGTEPGTFRDFLKSTGLSNHPAMVQFAYMAGKAIGEDTFERSGNVPQAKLSRAEKYYGAN